MSNQSGSSARGNLDLEDTPVQTTLNWEERGEIRLEPLYTPALSGLEDFTHAWVLTWLGQPDQRRGADVDLTQVPFLLRPTMQRKGILATRGPKRPNPIGLHLIRIVSVTVSPPVVAFQGVDMIDGTPVLDLKPWVGRFDVPPESNPRSGWYESVRYEATTPSQLSEEI